MNKTIVWIAIILIIIIGIILYSQAGGDETVPVSEDQEVPVEPTDTVEIDVDLEELKNEFLQELESFTDDLDDIEGFEDDDFSQELDEDLSGIAE